MSIQEDLKTQIALLPSMAGVYRFLDKSGKVIYVGKAKNLKKRVSSYFLNRDQPIKVAAMVRKIVAVEHTVVEREADAFLLENNMIKSLQPRYNILLKDDKTYPWIVLRHEQFPRVRSTRNVVKDGSKYFGPYPSITAQRSMLELVRKLYFIRDCNLKLTEQGIKRGKFSRCLEYHIGNCKAPCEGLQSLEEYNHSISQALSTLSGNLSEAKAYLNQKMMEEAQQLRFEEAQRYKDRLCMLESYQSKSVVVSPVEHNVDVFSLIVDSTVAFCNYLHIEKGAVIYSYSIEMKLGISDEPIEILNYAIPQILDIVNKPLSSIVIVPFMPDIELFRGSNFVVPQRGERLKLLELSEKNCRVYRLAKLKNLENTSPERHAQRITTQIQRDLRLSEPAMHIECFDNSNIQGTYPVAACVVFRGGKPSRKEYRHFNIKEVVGIDDFASMREVVTRRYQGMLEREEALPQLIVIDGGKGQLSMAYGVLQELGLEKRIAIVGLAKRLEEVFFPEDPYPLYLDKSGETLRVLMHIRDEAHRFGITFHRNKRSKGAINSSLNSIPSLGAVSVKNLLRKFKTISAISAASHQELAQVVGNKRAEAIIEFYKSKK